MFCKKNSLLITESERQYIRNLYGLLNEATGEDQITLTADSTFGPGKYSQLSAEGDAELNQQMQAATTWMTENKGSLIFVQIVASESRVTNYDTEQDPKVPVEQKVLSRLRAKTLKRKLKQLFQSLIDKGVLTEMPIFQEPKIDVGGPAYVQGKDNPKDAKYAPFQSVKVELKLMAPEKCLVNLEVEVKYVKEKNDSFPCRGGHTCDDARFEVKMNGIPIGTANLNNAKDGGDRTSGIIKIDEAKAKDIVGVNAKEITFSLKCLSGQNCHSGTPEIVIKKNGETIYHSCSPAMSRGDQNEYPIHTLDACGNVLEKGTGDATNKDVKTTETTTTDPGYIISLPKMKWDPVLWYVNNSDSGRIVQDKTKKGGTVGPKGLIYYDEYDNRKIMDVDPGTIFSGYVAYGKPNNKPLPIKNMEGLGWLDATGSGKYYVDSAVTNTGNETLVLKPGTSPRILDKEKSQNIVRFKLDDEAIEEFENYYIPKKLVEKTPDGMYKVIANKITYASNVYNKDTILKLDS